jgi:hypothetical protein
MVCVAELSDDDIANLMIAVGSVMIEKDLTFAEALDGSNQQDLEKHLQQCLELDNCENDPAFAADLAHVRELAAVSRMQLLGALCHSFPFFAP